MPYHRLETVVEAKPRNKGGGRAQAASYIYHVQQARPDRPGYYGLSAKPQYFQVLYSSPAGVAASERRQWSDLQNLCDYVYSLYDPPDDHFLYDGTISWSESKEFGPPTWTITVGGERYSGAVLTFIGRVWGRRTTIFMVRREGLPPIVIKEYYLHSGRRYEESHLLSLIHADGFMPGVVRLICAEEVLTNGKSIAFKYPKGQGLKTKSWTKHRLVLADSGLDLELARSVNDILMTFYDLLEVHRTVTRERRVLHRDISLFNILMYPTAVKCADAAWAKECPPLIDDVLQGQKRDAENRTARCVLIDYDNGALLEKSNKNIEELQNRTGTPVYIARAVSLGSVIIGTTGRWFPMPTLSDEAKSLYLAAYGEDRYNKYNDTSQTIHGGVPFLSSLDVMQKRRTEPFYHRWEYDAESIFWTMFAVLLRALPRDGVENKKTQQALENDWKLLTSHTIPEEDQSHMTDGRDSFFSRAPDQYVTAFLPAMQDVAVLIGEIALHVGPSYALMRQPPTHEDHLHEAMQRLILDYLVKHRDDPVPLTPGVMRAIRFRDGGRRERGRYSMTPITLAPSISITQSVSVAAQSVPVAAHSVPVAHAAPVAQSVPIMQSNPTSTMSSKRSRDEDEDEAPEAKRPHVTPPLNPKNKTLPVKLEPLPQPRDDDPLALKGLWTWSMFSAERDRILAASVLAK
ncbi:hypothetical protein BD413DRAFT_473747 [Trametes elegans]|nr:hypothetical protein BD413DRAFT_473747 [Trametes elegans]